MGDWGLGVGNWGVGPTPNPQSPIPNPQSPIPNPQFNKMKHLNFNIQLNLRIKYYLNFKNILILFI